MRFIEGLNVCLAENKTKYQKKLNLQKKKTKFSKGKIIIIENIYEKILKEQLHFIIYCFLNSLPLKIFVEMFSIVSINTNTAEYYTNCLTSYLKENSSIFNSCGSQ